MLTKEELESVSANIGDRVEIPSYITLWKTCRYGIVTKVRIGTAGPVLDIITDSGVEIKCPLFECKKIQS